MIGEEAVEAYEEDPTPLRGVPACDFDGEQCLTGAGRTLDDHALISGKRVQDRILPFRQSDHLMIEPVQRDAERRQFLEITTHELNKTSHLLGRQHGRIMARAARHIFTGILDSVGDKLIYGPAPGNDVVNAAQIPLRRGFAKLDVGEKRDAAESGPRLRRRPTEILADRVAKGGGNGPGLLHRGLPPFVYLAVAVSKEPASVFPLDSTALHFKNNHRLWADQNEVRLRIELVAVSGDAKRMKNSEPIRQFVLEACEEPPLGGTLAVLTDEIGNQSGHDVTPPTERMQSAAPVPCRR